MKTREARSAAFEHCLPVGSGALAGTLAAVLFPSDTRSVEFFGVAAQVLPVLLLALAIEARLFGIRPRRHAVGDKVARRLDDARVVLGFGTVVVLLVGELHALWTIGSDSTERRIAWVEYGALAWGFTTVAVLAVQGLGRPRLTATLKWRQPPGPPNRVLVEAGGSNEYGDKDVMPVLNFLIPDGLSVHRCDAYGNIDPAAPLTTLPVSWEYAGIKDWNYPSERLLVSAGDATLRYFSVGGLVPGRQYPVVLRFDHAELPNGRVEAEDQLRTEDGSASH